VLSKIRDRTGGCIRFFISGGSALNQETAEFFDSINVNVLQGYGLTEASPVVAVNRENKNKPGTVGPPLEGSNVKIADDGEILVGGDNVMKGYYKDEAETSKSIINGWLHTGDIGEFDEDGYIRITDRKKSLIKTSSGKYISLSHIEDILITSNYIDQAFAYATDARQFVTALIVPNFDELTVFANEHNLDFEDIRMLVDNRKVNEMFEKEINGLQKNLAKYERVRKFALVPSPFSIENGEMTPTLKLKRKIIVERCKEIIDGLYSGMY